MGHQYRVSPQPEELGMRRIFPIVLIRGIRIHRLDTLFNQLRVRQEENNAAEESDETPAASEVTQTRRSTRLARTRRTRRNKRTAEPSQPLRRSPRLNKGV